MGGVFFSPNQKRIFNRQGVSRDRSQLYFSLKLSYARIFAVYLLALRSHLIFSFSTSLQTGPVTNRGKDHLYRTNIGDCCGPRLIWLLCAEFSESIFALAPLSPLSAPKIFHMLRRYRGPMPRRISRNGCPHVPGRRWTASWRHSIR